MKKRIEFEHWTNIYYQKDSDELCNDETPKVHKFKTYEDRKNHIINALKLGDDQCQMLVVYREDGQNTVFVGRSSSEMMISYLEIIKEEELIVLMESNHDDHENLLSHISDIIYS